MTPGDVDDPACPNMSACAMYEVFTYSGTLGIWKDNYCKGPFATCARYKAGCEGRPVPDTLLPNGRLLKKLAVGP